MRALRAALLLSLVAAAEVSAQGRTSPLDRYDPVFRKYTKRYFGIGHDWRLFKAQGMAESDLTPTAKSRVGARGVMQLMPSTFAEIRSREPTLRSISDPEWNIAAGILHDSKLWGLWKEPPEGERRAFMFASYNAGRRTILNAQAMARACALHPLAWRSIETIAPQVPRWRHEETLGYVRKIEANMARLGPDGRVIVR